SPNRSTSWLARRRRRQRRRRQQQQSPNPLTSPAVFILYACSFSFLIYFSSYGVRKAFAAGEYKDLEPLLGVEMKTALVLSQLLGYTLAKYLGVKFCSELSARWRLPMLALLILWAELALVLFGLLPRRLKALALFLNGFPLGLIWGLVVRYL